MYLKPKWILQIYRMQNVLTLTEHTLTLGYFHVSLFLRDSLSLSFLSLNKTDVNCNCFKSFYENVSRLAHFFIKKKTSWSIEVLLTNYRTTWCCFYYTDQLEDYNIEQLKNQLEILYCLWQLAVEINTSVEKDLEQTVQRHCNESLWGGEFFSISIWRWTAELLGRRPPPLPPR